MGIGKGCSATTGANTVIVRATPFDIPIDVTANRVGNMCGCVIYSTVDAVEASQIIKVRITL